MRVAINKRLFLILLPAFMLVVVIGTLHHETGHYLAGRLMRLRSSIHFDYTQLAAGQQRTMQQLLWFSWGGPLQTMLTGSIALLLLYTFNHRQSLTLFSRYLLIFIAMFWVRQPINFSLGLLYYAVSRRWPEKGDEAKLSLYYHLPFWSVNAITAVLGTIVVVVVIFWFVPASHRFTFWLAGILGGAVGYFLWLVWLGKYILP